MQYDPKNWYWLADDGRIFASARQTMIKKSDATYKEWVASGGVPTRWPEDDIGMQTDMSLQGVIGRYGLALSPKASLIVYASDKRWRVETGGIMLDGMQVATDRESQSMIGNAVQMVKLTGKPVQFKTANGFVELSSEQMQNIAVAVATHVQACFAAEADVQAKIKSGEIDSVDKIDAYPWPGSPA